jgi:chitinase
VAADAEKRRRFAKECVGLIEDYGFDGIDIGMLYIHMQYYIDPFLSDIVIT